MARAIARTKKAKRDDRIVTYVRLRPEEHAKIEKIVEVRGYPHTLASVTAEMIERGLAAEAKAAGAPNVDVRRPRGEGN